MVMIIGLYFRFSLVRLNQLKNKLLANYLRNRGNDLATVRISAFCVAMLLNNSFISKNDSFPRKYKLSQFYKIGWQKKKIIRPIHKLAYQERCPLCHSVTGICPHGCGSAPVSKALNIILS